MQCRVQKSLCTVTNRQCIILKLFILVPIILIWYLLFSNYSGKNLPRPTLEPAFQAPCAKPRKWYRAGFFILVFFSSYCCFFMSQYMATEAALACPSVVHTISLVHVQSASLSQNLASTVIIHQTESVIIFMYPALPLFLVLLSGCYST